MDKLRSIPPTRQGWGDLTPDFSCPKSLELLDEGNLLNQPLTLQEKKSLDGTPMRQQALVANGFWDDWQPWNRWTAMSQPLSGQGVSQGSETVEDSLTVRINCR